MMRLYMLVSGIALGYAIRRLVEEVQKNKKAPTA
jgi:hypothetical protein